MTKSEITTIGSDSIPAPIIFTDSAAKKVCELIKEEENTSLKLRVFISGGGCSGLSIWIYF